MTVEIKRLAKMLVKTNRELQISKDNYRDDSRKALMEGVGNIF